MATGSQWYNESGPTKRVNAMQGLTTYRPLREELPMAVNQFTKVCPKCGIEKPVELFGKRSDRKSGLQSRCKECQSKTNAAYRSSNSDREKNRKIEYRARNFEKVIAKVKKWQSENKDRVREINRNASRKYYALNRDKERERGFIYREANRDKVRACKATNTARRRSAPGRLSESVATKLFKLQRGKCACCGLPLGNDYHLDHIMPLALGGTNTDDNIQLLRKTCNLQKSAKHPIDFMRQRGFLI